MNARDAALPGRSALSVTLHDVAPATQARCQLLIDRLQGIAPMVFTLLVVPYYHGKPSSAGFDEWLDTRLQGGDELALHGLTHHDDGTPADWLDHVWRRWYTDGEGEFAALDMAEATRRFNAGRRWFARRRWPVRGFVAPAWLLGDGAWRALRRQPFAYTCTRTALLALPSHGAAGVRTLAARSIVYSTRAAWRRRMSLPWNRFVARLESAANWVRFELHPNDVEHDAVCESALALVERAIAQGRQPVTLGAMADRLRASAIN
jgi:predicted deacetylase